MNGSTASRIFSRPMPLALAAGMLCLTPFCGRAPGQVLTVGSPGQEFARYAEIKQTKVPLSTARVTERTRRELLRLFQAEQGFAVRPLPRGSRGIVLVANGGFERGPEEYLKALSEKGVSAKPGDRVVLSDVKIAHDRIVFDINGGPDKKHRILRHISISGAGGEVPLAQDDGVEPTGSRMTLVFKGGVPEMTGEQVRALIQPVIDFSVKTPAEAFTDTLPPRLKSAILNHEVLVGMTTEMVLFSVGRPDKKSREREGDMPYEEWIYGEPPKEVAFVRINGNRVIRVETAKVGQDPVIRTKDEVGELAGIAPEEHRVQLGDVVKGAEEAPKAPPTLRREGEKLPGDDAPGAMGPVQFPKDIDRSGGSKPSSQPENPPAPASPPPAPPSNIVARQ